MVKISGVRFANSARSGSNSSIAVTNPILETSYGPKMSSIRDKKAFKNVTPMLAKNKSVESRISTVKEYVVGKKLINITSSGV